MEVQRTRFEAARWPGVVRLPLVAAGLEDGRLGGRGLPVLQVMEKEGEFQLLTVVLACRRAEPDVPKGITRHRRPAAVQPRPDDDAAGVIRSLFQRAIRFEWAVE